MTRHSSLLERRQNYIDELEIGLKKVVATLSEKPKVQKIVLFGSFAAGRRDLFTDLDILVVMDLDEDFVTRSAHLRSQLWVGIDLDLLVYTPEEYEQIRKRGFLEHALRDCVVLYERK